MRKSCSINISGSDPALAEKLAQLDLPIFPITSLSGIYADTQVNSVGKGGSISIDAGNLSVSDRAGIAVGSGGQGSAGNLRIQSNLTELDREAFLSAETVSGDSISFISSLPSNSYKILSYAFLI